MKIYGINEEMDDKAGLFWSGIFCICIKMCTYKSYALHDDALVQ